MRGLVVATLVVGAVGCSVQHRVDVFPAGAPPRWICIDGRPVRILQDVHCQDGICGYSCLPDRWATPSPE